MDMNSVGNLLVDTESIGTRTGLNPKRTTLIYTGQRTERPYRDGAAWICSRLTVGLGSLLSETQIILTGKGARIPCPYPQVIFTGLVENFLEYLAAADICLLPVWREVGIAGKIVEYMAMGKPVVATHFIRGLDHLRDGYDVLIARNEQEFVDKVIYLVRNPAEARAIGLRARESARRHHSYEAIAPRVWQLLDGISQTSK
jgi:glycosyltransferase involved in cell wall biosynthesis